MHEGLGRPAQVRSYCRSRESGSKCSGSSFADWRSGFSRSCWSLAAVLDLLTELQANRATTYVFVSHDLAVVRSVADRVAVLYQGGLCEMGPSSSGEHV